MIQLNQVSKQYAGKRALRKVDLTLPRGEIVGLFGENGAGTVSYTHLEQKRRPPR